MSDWGRFFAILVIVATGFTLLACGLKGGSYPSTDINFLVPFAPGGATDAVSRKLTQEAEPLLKGKFVVVNKPGASGTLAVAEVIKAKPDGYTIGLTGIGQLALQPQVSQLPYGGPEDCQPILNVVELPNALFVQSQASWKTLKDFMEDAKKQPDQIRVATTGKLTAGSMIMQELNSFSDVKITSVPFTTGAGEATTALLGGHIEALITEPGPLLNQVQAGKLRLLAVMQGDRLDSLSDVPSAAEQIGYKSTVPVPSYAIIAPEGHRQGYHRQTVQDIQRCCTRCGL